MGRPPADAHEADDEPEHGVPAESFGGNDSGLEPEGQQSDRLNKGFGESVQDLAQRQARVGVVVGPLAGISA